MKYYAIFNKNYGGYRVIKTKKRIATLAEAEKLLNPWEDEPDFVPSTLIAHYVPVICLPIPAIAYYIEQKTPLNIIFDRLHVIVK